MTERPAATDIQDFADRFAKASQLVAARQQKLLDQFGFTATQLGMLRRIAKTPSDDPAPRVGDLAQAAQITQPAATKMVSKFDKFGLISLANETEDKRVKQVRITQDGLDLCHKMEMTLLPDVQAWFGDWNKDHLLAFTALLGRLGTWLDDNKA